MPRGQRRSTTDVSTLEAELTRIKERQAEVRRLLRQMRGGDTEMRKLQEKLEKQLAVAKWTVQQIHELRPDWDDLGFYQTIRAAKPTPRGRRPRQTAS